MMQPFVSFAVRADSPEGVQVSASIDEDKWTASSDFRVFEHVQVQIQLQKE